MGYQRERLSNYSKKSHDQQTLPITGLMNIQFIELFPACIECCHLAKVKLWHSLSIFPFICRVWKLFCVCGLLCTETRERAGLAAGVWLNNSGYWQSGAGLLTSPIPADDPHTELSISLSHEDSASFRHEYILPHLVEQSFSIWPWQGHIQNGSHPTPQGLCTNEAELN